MLSAGKQVGPYEIVSLLGAGGMGEVYRARDGRLGRTVALKILTPGAASDERGLLWAQRFEQEARAASALNHPNIITVFDTGAQEGMAYIVSELIEGESLRDAIRRGPMPQSRVAELGGQVAEALGAAHASGIIDRDLKPENIMVTRDGRAKVLDFGLAKQVTPRAADADETAELTRTSPGTVLGTAGYMSPEQVRGEALGAASDIFSLGIVLHECLSGGNPFERATAVEAMAAILREDPPELAATVSPALRQVVLHCLEKEPERRFHAARDLAFALRTAGGSRSSGPAPTVEAAPRRGRMWLWPAAALALLLAGLAVERALEVEPLDLAGYHYVPFATEPEPESEAAWSPDGKSVAYIKTVDGIPQLMVRALDATAPVQLTRGRDPIGWPFWAPDSALLYYIRSEEGAPNGEVWAISPAGGRPMHILDDAQSAALSPDGKSMALWRVVVEGHTARGALWLASAGQGGGFAMPRRYQPSPFETHFDTAGNFASFSPDGSSLLLVIGNNDPQLWLLPLPAGRGQPRRLFAATEFNVIHRASWMPDSRHAVLAFAGSTGSSSGLWLADLKREKLRRLTAGTAAESDPTLAPDGHRVIFTSTDDDYNLVELPLDGSAPRTLVASARNEFSPSWSSGGDQMIYSTDRSGVYEIWIRNVKAGIDWPAVTPRAFPPGTTTGLTDPVFSPDGRRFAFVRYSTDEPATIWIAPTVGGAPIRLARAYFQSPAWSPDGNFIAGLLYHDHPWHPAIVEVGADMTPHVMPNAMTCTTAPDWSPSGDWIACDTREGMMLLSPDGAKMKMLGKLGASAVVFSRDGKTVYAVGREAGRTFLKAVTVDTGAVRTLAEYAAGLIVSGGAAYRTRLSLAPDGKSLATSAVTAKSDLWILDGFPLPRPWWRILR